MTIEEKYNIIYKGKERFYKISLTDNKRTDLEKTRPENSIVEDKEFDDNSWGGLLVSVTKYLLERKYITIEQLFSFTTTWYDKTLYSDYELTNFRAVCDNLYVNGNLGSVRTYWLICDVLYYSGVQLSDCSMLIKRYGVAEPDEVKEYVMKNNLEIFHKYLADKGMDNDRIVKYERNIKAIDDILRNYTNSKTAYSILLIDFNRLLYDVKKDLLGTFKKRLNEAQCNFASSIINDYYVCMTKYWKK